MRTTLLILSVLLPISPAFVYSWNETEISIEPSTSFSSDISQDQKIGLIVLFSCLCASAIFGAKRVLCPTRSQRRRDIAQQRAHLDQIRTRRGETEDEFDLQESILQTEIVSLENKLSS